MVVFKTIKVCGITLKRRCGTKKSRGRINNVFMCYIDLLAFFRITNNNRDLKYIFVQNQNIRFFKNI